MQVNMLEAKTQLSKLVEAALHGEDVVIANRGQPVVRLVKVQAKVRRRTGAWAGLMTEAEIERAFSPEVEAEMAREWLASLDKPDPPARTGKRPPSKATAGATGKKPARAPRR